MTVISKEALLREGEELCSRIREKEIPYVSGGASLDGMDCQGLVEYCLIRAGVPKSECNLKGSNAHWRACTWHGTPEECKKHFGEVPDGAAVFIVVHDGGEVDRGYRDDLGNANHIGLVLEGRALHASSSRGGVAESAFYDKTIPNGGWNMIGLLPWVDYGTTSEDTSTDFEQEAEADEYEAVDGLTAGIPVKSTVVYKVVHSPDGNPVKLRKTASQKENVYWKVNPGAHVRVEKVRGDWSLITAICTDGYQRRAYMLSDFLKDE